MSFLRRRMDASESKYFKEDSEVKASELRKRLDKGSRASGLGEAGTDGSPASSSFSLPSGPALAQVLPEVLAHALPLSLRNSPVSSSSSDGASPVLSSWGAVRQRYAMPPSTGAASMPGTPGSIASSVVQLPQIRLGPAKYQMVFPDSSSLSSLDTSTANERRAVASAAATVSAQTRAEQVAAMNKAIMMVGKAYGVATLLVYGGAALLAGLTLSSMGVTKIEEIPEKGRQALEPRVEAIRAWIEPWRTQVEEAKQAWRLSEEEQKAVGQKYAQVLGAPQSRNRSE